MSMHTERKEHIAIMKWILSRLPGPGAVPVGSAHGRFSVLPRGLFGKREVFLAFCESYYTISLCALRSPRELSPRKARNQSATLFFCHTDFPYAVYDGRRFPKARIQVQEHTHTRLTHSLSLSLSHTNTICACSRSSVH